MGSLKRLAAHLEKIIPRPANPKRKLEQYRTNPELALVMASLLPADCSIVIDFGCGTGMLSYATAYTRSAYVVGIDIDAEQVEKARAVSDYGMLLIDFVVGDVRHAPFRECRRCCVIQNPPFGVYRYGADLAFLSSALNLNVGSIVTLHKYNERSLKLIVNTLESNGYNIIKILRTEIVIPAMYESHVRRTYRVEVVVFAAIKGRGCT